MCIRDREFGAPQQISTGFASWQRYCSDVTLCPRLAFSYLGWPTSDNLRPIKPHHNHSRTTPERLHNHTTTTPQPHHNHSTALFQLWSGYGVTPQPLHSHSTTTPQLFSVVEWLWSHTTTTPQPLHNFFQLWCDSTTTPQLKKSCGVVVESLWSGCGVT